MRNNETHCSGLMAPLKKELKVDYARLDGLSDITHLALFLSYTFILSRLGMLLMMRTYILKRQVAGTGMLILGEMLMACSMCSQILSILQHL